MIITETRRIVFPSVRQNINIIEKLVNELSDFYNIGEEHYANILVALSEAVTNAMEHGNQLDSDKMVEVNFETRGSSLCFTVKDEGNGFDPSTLPDPTDPSRLEVPGGRGVFIMQKLSDKMEVLDNGRKIELYFNLTNQ
jgi:serine/threonine-protein kinase RsbW